jgi:hypothetical protein
MDQNFKIPRFLKASVQLSILFETPKLLQYISSIYLLPNNVEKIFENPNRSNCYKRINT